MSYFENLTPKHALESLGLRRDEPMLMDVLFPVLAAFGLGLGVGAGAALLLAPQSGRELRGDLSRRAGDLRGDIQRSATRLEAKARGKTTDNGTHTDHADWAGGKTTANEG